MIDPTDSINPADDPGEAEPTRVRTKVRIRTGTATKSSRRKKHRRKIIWRWILGIALFAVVCAGWLGFSGFMAAKSVKAAQADLAQLQSAMASVSAQQQLADPKITTLLNQASEATDRAVFWTSGPVWWGAGQVPVAGNTISAIRATVVGTDIAVSKALPPVVKAAQIVSAQKLRTSGGAFNTQTIANTQHPLANALLEMDSAVAAADRAPASWVLPAIATQADDANSKLHQIQGQIKGLSTASRVLPSILGAKTKQKYFVAFTNPTEARAGGGFLGAYGILTADNGKVKLSKIGINSDLKELNKPAVDLGPEYKSIYGNNTTLWQNMNLSPHFPYAAQQYIAGWNKRTGAQLTGALSVDVVTLAYLSDVTGPIKLPNGKVLKRDQIVNYLTNGIYVEYDGRDSERDDLQVAIAGKLVDELLTGNQSPIALARPFARAVSEGRVLFYSTDPEVESQIIGTPVSGVIDNRYGPYAYLVVNNYSGNKIDFYLDRTLRYEQTACSGGKAATTITTTLVNDVPAGKKLPAYIVGRSDDGAKGKASATTRTSQLVLLPMGADVESVKLNGKPAQYTLVGENARPGVLVYTELSPRVPATLEIDLVEPGSSAQPRFPVQPLVRDQKTIVSWKPCT